MIVRAFINGDKRRQRVRMLHFKKAAFTLGSALLHALEGLRSAGFKARLAGSQQNAFMILFFELLVAFISRG